jgi:hypothetical protein
MSRGEAGRDSSTPAKYLWLYNASNDQYTCYHPHAKRGGEALSDMGILPHFHGILCYDHWKPYYSGFYKTVFLMKTLNLW